MPCPLLHIQQQIPNTGIGLLAGRNNLVCRQDKAICTCVTELGREGVIGLRNVIGPVDATPGCLVDGGTYRAVLEGSAVHSPDGGGSALGKSLELGVLGGLGGAGIPIRCRPVSISTIKSCS